MLHERKGIQVMLSAEETEFNGHPVTTERVPKIVSSYRKTKLLSQISAFGGEGET